MGKKIKDKSRSDFDYTQTFDDDDNFKIKKRYTVPISKPYTINNVQLKRTKTGYALTLDSSRKLNGEEIREAISHVMQLM